jgi:hypothetical protein
MHALNRNDQAISSTLEMRLSLDVVLHEVVTKLLVDAASSVARPTSICGAMQPVRDFVLQKFVDRECGLGEGMQVRLAWSAYPSHFHLVRKRIALPG